VILSVNLESNVVDDESNTPDISMVLSTTAHDNPGGSDPFKSITLDPVRAEKEMITGLRLKL
jgi:hypothetical protein